LSGFAYTFLISLGTVVLAQATSAMKGVKGAGQMHPARSDLIVHGGVIAPERVQQVVWSVLAGLAFLWITIRTYATATALPTIPEELLVLMGISSAGYLVGKVGRKPGPIIQQVLVEEGSVRLRIYGEHLYRHAFVWVDGIQQPKDAIKPGEEDNPERPNEFVKSLQVTLPDISREEWYGQKHTVVIINADGQQAQWQASFPKILTVTQSSGAADAQGRVTLEVKGSGILPKAKLVVGDAPSNIQMEQDPTDPNRWTILIEQSWLGQKHRLEITNPEGDKYTYVWQPPTNG
jgi:hypothetical protein